MIASAPTVSYVGAAIAESYRHLPQTGEDDRLAIPTYIPAGTDEGIGHDSVATFDNLAAVPESVLTTRLGSLGADGRLQICRALEAMANC